MKRKTMTLVLCLLAALALVSVGFASWVISAGTSAEASGDITVETVTDKRLVATANITSEVKSFVFGAPKDETAKWLSNDTKENLTITVTVHVSDKQNAKVSNAVVKGTLTAKDGKDLNTNTKYAAAVEAGYVAALSIDAVSFAPVPETPGDYTATFTIAWGSLWKDSAGRAQNPFTYFNGQDANAVASGSGELVKTYADLANEQLTAMYEALDGVQFVIKITVDPAA
ncbi:MAG: hypothetical protein MRZ17_06115 [Acholeplasmataceae bacterium]|nr:hypothetical protein [Acholeplasmataceae bacterium]